MERKPQSLGNHAKFDEPFHFLMMPVAAFSMIVSIGHAYKYPNFDSIWLAVIAVTVFVAVVRIRTYPLKVQDRLIRLEERLRLTQLLSDPLRSRINDLTESQLVALRFASDAEVPALVEKTLGGKLTSKQIKEQIRNWRADYFRV
jgi:hypothetical protein